MNADTKKIDFFYWAPRVLAIVFICFLALFALDVFIPGKTLGYYFVAFFMHLIPNFVLAGILVVAWKHESAGGLLFLFTAIFFTLFFKTYLLLPHFIIVSFPIVLIGILFLAHGSLPSKTYSSLKRLYRR